MAITTEELNIKVKVDSSGVDLGIKDIKAKLAELNSVASKHSVSNLTGLSERMAKLANSCRSVSNVDLSGMTNFISQMNQLTASGKDVSKGADTLVSSMKKIYKAADTLSKTSGQNMSQSLQPITKFTQDLQNSISNVDLESFSKYANALSKVASAYKTLNGVGSKAPKSSGKEKENVGLMVDLSKHLFDLKPDFFIEAYKKFFEIMKLPFEEMAEKFIGYGKTIKNFMNSIGRVALYRAIRTGIKLVTQAIKTGVNNLYQWAALVGNSFKPTMDSLATSFQYLQNSIGAAVSPLLDMAAPVLEYIINAAVAALNVLNQLFSLLGGKSTYRKAIRQNKEYAKSANAAAGGAGALNDELERTILAFDEINKLNGTKDKAGGGGGGGGAADVDYAGMFEEVDIDNGLAELIRQDSWEAIGIAITDRLADAMEAIDWDAIQEKTAEVAYKIATLLNGAFSNKRFWIDIGTTIAEGLNTYTLLDTTFFHNTNFEDFGDSLAEAVRQAIITVDWEQLGEACVSIPTAIIESIHGFVENWSIEDWSFLGDSIAEMVNGALLELPFEIAIPDFVELATGILHSLNQAIENIKWSEVLGKIAEGFKNADWAGLIKELGAFLWNTKWVIAIALTLEIGKVGFMLAATALKAKIWSAVLNGSGGLLGSGGGAAGGAAAGGAGLFLKQAIPVVVGLGLSIGGVVSYINALNTESIIDDIASAVASSFGAFTLGKKIFGTAAGGGILATIPLTIELVVTLKKIVNDQINDFRENFKEYSSKWIEDGLLTTNEQSRILEEGLNSSNPDVYTRARELAQRLKSGDAAVDEFEDLNAALKNTSTSILDVAEAYEAATNSRGVMGGSGSPLVTTISKRLLENTAQSQNEVPYSIAQTVLKSPDLVKRINSLKAVGTAMTTFAKKTRDTILGYSTVEPDMVKLAENAGSATFGVQKNYSASMMAKSIATTKAIITDFNMSDPISTRVSNAMGKAVSGINTGAVNSKTAASTLRSNVLAQMSMADDMLNLANKAMSHFKQGLTDALSQITTSANSLRNAILTSLTISLTNTGKEIGIQLSDGIRSQSGAVGVAAESLKNSVTKALSGISVANYGAEATNQFITGVRNQAPAAQDAGYHVRNYLINGLATAAAPANQQGANAVKQFINGVYNNAAPAQDAGYHARNYLINGLASSSGYAYQWGADAGANFANGIRSQVGAVANAAASVAQAMRAYLHFSEPDTGPLSDASTYMPDFMTLMAQGIRDNAWRVKNEVNNVASMMRPNFNASANYSVDAVVGGGMATALADALGGVSMQMNGNQPINVFIGGEKLDSMNARSQARTSFRSGGR